MTNSTEMPSPERFFAAATSYQQSAAIKGAIELDLFTAIGEGKTTVAALAERTRASERGIRILCDYMTIMGFLTKSDGQYGLAPDSAMFLNRNSPAYLGGAVEFLQSPMLFEAHADIAQVVRKGGTIVGDDGSVSPENPVWVQFARAMMPMMIMPAQLMIQIAPPATDRPVKLLDIAAGHGIFGITYAQKFPNLSVTALDWAPVLEVAKENAQKFGVADRHHLLPGSAFDVDFGTGYDLVLLTNFLHHFDIPTCEKLLKKVHGALGEGGRAVTLEFVPNEDRVTPPQAASFSMTMLASTRGGDAYTFAEYDRMFKNAGFSANEIHPLSPMPSSVIVSKA